MAVTITNGPENWSISGHPQAPHNIAEFDCTHEPLSNLKKLKYKLTQTEGSDFHGHLEKHTWISPIDGHCDIIWFGVGSYTLQLLEIDRHPDGGDSIAAESNIVSFEVTA